jgi:hypothetical protein
LAKQKSFNELIFNFVQEEAKKISADKRDEKSAMSEA